MFGTGELWGVLYRSYASIGESSTRQTQILRDYAHILDLCGISGHLHREDDVMFQWFEGPRASVAMVRDMILAHESHHGVHLFADKPITARRFDRWSYGSYTVNGVSIFNWANEVNKPLALNTPNVLIDFLKVTSTDPRP